MADTNVQRSNFATCTEAHNKPTTRSEATLHDVSDTLHGSDFFSSRTTGVDAPSRFWSAYERVAKQHDDEFIERHNGEMNVLLLFAGLFSAVSSAFIVNMQSSLSPSASDTTNALLRMLVNKIDNTTFLEQEAALPVWTGPSSATIWIQTLAYASLSTSLLAASGAILGKQWLGHYKTSRFGQGGLHERCQRRQQKLDGLEAWDFSAILATLPIFLQLSLFLFSIALTVNIWTLQHTVASVILATTAFGLVFYAFTVVSSLKSQNCPFQTPVSTVLQHVLRNLALFATMVQKKWKGHPNTWNDLLGGLLWFSRRAFYAAKDLIVQCGSLAVMFLSQIPFALRRKVRPLTNVPEAAPEITSEEMYLGSLERSVEIAKVYVVQSDAIQWILKTSTNVDDITAAAGMVPEIEWPPDDNVAGVLSRLTSHFYACFDSTRQILPLAQARAAACMKAMCHFYVERDLDNPFRFYPCGDIYSRAHDRMYYMLPDLAYRVYCAATGYPVNLEIQSLPLSDRLWMAHVFTYHLHRGNSDLRFIAFVVDFIGACLDAKSPSRLAADCLLLSGMLLGGKVDQRHLTKLDKRSAVATLQSSVMSRTLAALAGDIPGQRDIALKLAYPVLQNCVKNGGFIGSDDLLREQALRCSVLFLEDGGVNPMGDQTLALLFNVAVRDRSLVPRDIRDRLVPGDWYTPAYFDLLVDYHLRVCESRDYEAIGDTFWLLGGLHGGLPSASYRVRRYVDTIIYYMGQRVTRDVALSAAFAVRTAVALMGRNDDSLRERFSSALASAILLDVAQGPLDDNPFTEFSFFSWIRDMNYLRVLCVLFQEPTWRPQLCQNGHSDNCLAIAETLSSLRDVVFTEYAIAVAHIIALVDDADEERLLFASVQAFSGWRSLVLRAWRYTFRIPFFGGIMVVWNMSTGECLAALPLLVTYARRRCSEDDEGSSLYRIIALVEEVCRICDEQVWGVLDDASGNQEILDLGGELRQLLDPAHGAC